MVGHNRSDRVEVVADEDDRPALALRHLHAPEALALELGVAHGQHLVDHEDVGLEVGGHREGQPQVHARRVPLDGGVEEPLDAREGDDLVEAAAHLLAGHAQDGAVQVDVLPSRQLGVEPGAHLQQGTHPAPRTGHARRRLRDPGEDLEQRALPGAVAADHAEGLTLGHLEVDVPQRPHLLDGGAGPGPPHEPGAEPGDGLPQVGPVVLPQEVPLRDALELDGVASHQMMSAKRRSSRAKTAIPTTRTTARTTSPTSAEGSGAGVSRRAQRKASMIPAIGLRA